MKHRMIVSAVAICALLVGVAAEDVWGDVGDELVFTDVTATAGVGLVGDLTESVAWGDYDDDGDQDLYLTNDGVNRLFRNDGSDVFTDVTAVTGVGHPGWGVGAAFGDLNNDGYLDLYVVNISGGIDALYRNRGPIGPGGEYFFTDLAEFVGITVERSSRGMALLDYNRDGALDIYVMAVGENILYHNLGTMPFVDVAASLGVNVANIGVGVVCSDVDDNGWIDIYTGNRSGTMSSLFMNDHAAFTDMAAAAGVTAAGLGMGVMSFDFDNDLDFDLYWTTWPGGPDPEPNRLYENVGGVSFVDVAGASGTADTTGWGISCNAGDVNNDGWQDFFVTNGFSSETTANVLFVNQGTEVFADFTAALGGAAFDGRGVAFADYNNDGKLDLVVTADAGESTRLWRNDTASGNHWITLNLIGTVSNRSAIGARLEVATPLATTVQEVSGGAGRGSQNSLPVEFGLGAATTIDEIVVRWPNGGLQMLQDVTVDQVLTITEPLWGDLNCDGAIDGLDAAPFVTALLDPTAYRAAYPDCDINSANLNADRVIDVGDADSFVQCLLAGACP